MTGKCAREDGFTLVEVLVAFVVAGLLLGIVFETMTGARARKQQMETRMEAVLLAEQLLREDEIGGYRSAPRAGHTDALNWKVEQQVLRLDPTQRWALVEIRAQISEKTAKDPDSVLFAAALRKLKRYGE